MENASKALIIAGAVLLSVMVISLLIYTGKSFSIIAKAEQEAKLTEDRKKFNAEYEVYDKNLMYGTDVLSCLNKAQNNNQKYVNYNYYGTDNLESEYRKEYLIEVEVTLKKTIQESVRVYNLGTSGKKVQLTDGVEATPTAKMFQNNHFEVPDNIVWYYFENKKVKKGTASYAQVLWSDPTTKLNYNLKSTTFNTKLTANASGTTYKLLSETNPDHIGKLSALLSTATTMEQTIINKDYGTGSVSGGVSTDWYSATWRTAAYDFKTRKFKCTGIEYNSDTGYVSKLKFEEINTY